jgi:hypothetical protein
MPKYPFFIYFALLLALPGLADSSAGDYRKETWNPFDPGKVLGFGNQTLTPNFGLHGEMPLHLSAVDLKQDAGTPVYAVRKGVPSFPKADLTGWTTTVQVLGDDGILTYFMHLEPTSIPDSLKADMAANRPIEKGTLLGVLYKHKHLKPHVHFGAADCRNHLRINPQPLVDYTDTVAPTISKIVAHDPKDGEMKDLGDTVRGDIDLTVFAHDSTGRENEVLPLTRLEFEIRSANVRVFTSTVFDSSTMPARASAHDDSCQDFVDYDGYDSRLGEAIYRRAGVRKLMREKMVGFPYSLTRDTDFVTEELRSWFQPYYGTWKTAKFANGRYELHVRATDAKGNHADYRRTLQVAN